MTTFILGTITVICLICLFLVIKELRMERKYFSGTVIEKKHDLHSSYRNRVTVWDHILHINRTTYIAVHQPDCYLLVLQLEGSPEQVTVFVSQEDFARYQVGSIYTASLKQMQAPDPYVFECPY